MIESEQNRLFVRRYTRYWLKDEIYDVYVNARRPSREFS